MRLPRRFLLWGPVGAIMATLFYLSSQPWLPTPDAVDDKTLHYLAYTALGVSVARALGGGLPAHVTMRIMWLTLLITVGYGATDEIHQMFVPGRSADPFDLVADAAGAVMALGVCAAYDRLYDDFGGPRQRAPHRRGGV